MDGPSRRPTDSSRSEGMPSPSEAPSGGAKTFWLLLGRLPKVTRCKSGTASRRDRSNGYVLTPQKKSVQITRIMPLTQLLRNLPRNPIHPAPPLHRRPRLNRVRPTQHMLVLMHRQKLRRLPI